MKKKQTIRGAIKGVLDWSTDGCTASPDFNFTGCCEDHDFSYRNAAISRRQADRRLRACIRSKGWVLLPWVYWIAVRLFGWRAYNWDKLASTRGLKYGVHAKPTESARIAVKTATEMASSIKKIHQLRVMALWLLKMMLLYTRK